MTPPQTSIPPVGGVQNLKSFLQEEETAIRNFHIAGASGAEIVQRRTALIDRVLRELHETNAAGDPVPALLAIGGYGRGELNPRSDIDIMFLCRTGKERDRATPLLYALWDAGMDIGYSVRTVPECVDLGRTDGKIRTSLLESRQLAGDAVLYASFIERMNAEVFFRKPEAFISEKIAERAAQRLKFGGSLYLREPNVKESAGGLRDFHLARWIAFTRFRTFSFDDLVARGVVTAGQLTVFLRSRNFLWRVRNEIHYQTDRKSDQLTFDLQEAVARNFRYRDSSHLLAVERFMKSYFLHARNVQEFSRIVYERALPRAGRPWFASKRRVGPFTLLGRTLLPASETDLLKHPEQLMEAFALHRESTIEFSDGLRDLFRKARFEDGVRRSPAAAKTFLAMLNEPEKLADTLTLMRDLRYLGRYLPEFRVIQALARHDYYHTYTVDEHILTAIRRLDDLWMGRYPALDSLYAAFRDVKKRWILMLSVLLHDLGKAYRNEHEEHGKVIAGRILDRLGVQGEDRDRVLLLVERHVDMALLSQRRELTDKKVVEEFARTVGDRENLLMLYLLTYADLAAVSPTAWSNWKASLLQELFLRTAKYFEQAEIDEKEGQRIAAIRDRLLAASAGMFTRDEVLRFVEAMPVPYLLLTSVPKMLRHLEMVKVLPGELLVIRHRNRPKDGCTELTVCAYDAYGMFYRTAGTLAAQGLNILRAQVYTAKNGIMIDTFQVTDTDGNPVTYEEVWRAIRKELFRVLSGGKPPEPSVTTYQRMQPGKVDASVTFDNETSESLTIIDISARDCVGLLYRITKTLYDQNLDIASAKIVTEGIRALDSFYVSDLLKNKITDPERLDKIREALLAVLG